MSSPTEQLAGIIPMVIMGGIAVRMTESLYGTPVKKRKTKRNARRRKSRGFGDFSNLF